MTLKIVILLQIFIAATAHSDQVGKTALAVKSKDCIAIVESAYTDIVNGDMGSASEKLKGLENDAEELGRRAEEKAKETERMEGQHKQKAKEMQRKVSDLHMQVTGIKSRKSGLEMTLAKQEKTLSDYKNELSCADSDYYTAKWRLEEAKEKQNVRRGFGGTLGAIFGTFFLPGLGTILGGVFGVGTGQIINEMTDDVARAKSRLDRARQEYSAAERHIESIKAQISSTTNEINKLEHKIQDLERQHSQYNNEATRMKEIMQFFVRASYFWKEFKQLSEHGADRTAFLQRLINKAKEIENYDFLKNRGCERTVMTFLEAWDMMVTKYMEESDFVHRIA